MSLSNAGGGVGEATGAALTAWLGVTATDFTRLPLLVSLCAGASALPLLLLPLVGKRSDGGRGGGESERRKDSESGANEGGGAELEQRQESHGEASELVPLTKKSNGEGSVV